jgi:Arc/MetJ family transcription regulator
MKVMHQRRGFLGGITSKILCMAKDKATITVDREQVREARRLTGAPTTSAAIDLALRELIRNARLRNDLKAYEAFPQGVDEHALAALKPDWAGLADDTDWEAEFP